jgi:hypothetical protein
MVLDLLLEGADVRAESDCCSVSGISADNESRQVGGMLTVYIFFVSYKLP